MHFGIEGYFNLTVRDSSTMEIKRETGFFKNLITNIGLDQIAADGVLYGVAVGTGSAPPSASDTILQAQTGYAFGNIVDTLAIRSSGAPYWSGVRRTFRLPQGQGTGNLTEVGICMYNTNRLWSRALILDASGNPTTLTVLENEVLDVTYECRIYSQEGDVTGGPIDLLGTDYTWTVRACEVTLDLASGALTSSGLARQLNFLAASSSPLTDQTQGVSNTSGVGTTSISGYVIGSFKRQAILTWAISQGNNSTGIQSFSVVAGPTTTGFPRFKVGFDKLFPKGNTISLTLNFEWSWGRKEV